MVVVASAMSAPAEDRALVHEGYRARAAFQNGVAHLDSSIQATAMGIDAEDQGVALACLREDAIDE